MPGSDRPQIPRIKLSEFAQLASGIKLVPWQIRIVDEMERRLKAGENLTARFPPR